MTSNHGDHKCNDCKEKVPTFMELLKHVAKNHYKEGDPHEHISEGDASENIEEIQTNKNSDRVEEGGKEYDPGFVFKEFKLGE